MSASSDWDSAWELSKGYLLDQLAYILDKPFEIADVALEVLNHIVQWAGPILPASILEWLTLEIEELLQAVADGRELVAEEVGYDAGDSVKAMVVNMMRLHGLNVDDDDPFGSESMSNAISTLTGYPFNDIFDEEQTTADLKAIAALKIEEATGIPLDLEDPESIGNFAAALLEGAINGSLESIDASAICPAVNTVAELLCKVPNCHSCMDDEEDCIARRDKAKNNRDKYSKKCSRVPKDTPPDDDPPVDDGGETP